MTVEVTARAIDVLRRALEAGRLDPTDVGIRLSMAGRELRTGFAEQPEPDEVTIEAGGVRLFVPPDLAGTLDVEAEHDRIVLR